MGSFKIGVHHLNEQFYKAYSVTNMKLIWKKAFWRCSLVVGPKNTCQVRLIRIHWLCWWRRWGLNEHTYLIFMQKEFMSVVWTQKWWSSNFPGLFKVGSEVPNYARIKTPDMFWVTWVVYQIKETRCAGQNFEKCPLAMFLSRRSGTCCTLTSLQHL